MKIVIASSNKGKLREFESLLKDTGWQAIPQTELGVTDIEETGLSFIENAILKARNASRATGLPAVADDSGLCVAELGDKPGLYSARFAGTHGDAQANMSRLRGLIRELGTDVHPAFFISVIAFVQHADDPAPIVVEGRWPGQVIDDQRGEYGFGYDPMFLDPNFNQTAAEIDPEIKYSISHRGRAMRKLHEQLKPALLIAGQ